MKICNLQNEKSVFCEMSHQQFRFSFRKIEIFISQITDFHFANYRFRKYRFSFRFVPFRFANYSNPIKHTVHENKENNHQLSNVLIFNQILPTSNIRNMRRIVRKIWMLILDVKGLKSYYKYLEQLLGSIVGVAE